MQTPIVLIIYKRPNTTRYVLEQIRQLQPSKLFVIADGATTPEEELQCQITRSVIDQMIDWNCHVQMDYATTNLGCAKRISSGLDWVFEQTETAIILEDDCIPEPSFFQFCEQLLEHYRFDTRISSISGQNFSRYKSEDIVNHHSYYFSRYPHSWGWATWRRAWQKFDFEMSLWQTVKSEGLLERCLESPKAVQQWTQVLQSTYNDEIDSWSFRWVLSCWLQNSLSIHPYVNLVKNIGFDRLTATHTTNAQSKLANLQTTPIAFPLMHPPYLLRHQQADQEIQQTLFSESTLSQRLRSHILRLVK